MGATASKKSTMILYSSMDDIHAHRIRIALAEKGVSPDLIEIAANEQNEDLLTLNPHHSLPTLVDRQLVLHHPVIILEYVDERFPHPPLLPVYPVARAQTRMMIQRIETEWYDRVYQIQAQNEQSEHARKILTESLIQIADIFNHKAYFMSDEFSMLDCSILPILWRLPNLGIQLPKQTKALENYAKKMFKRDSFINSLTDNEREMRD